VIDANMGLVALAQGDATRAVTLLQSAVARDPGFLEARFNLARALAVDGRREDAMREAQRLLSDLPSAAPQRPELQRLIQALK
jgi:cytochrome c-type biogenesis protein CcmH/NrfG